MSSCGDVEQVVEGVTRSDCSEKPIHEDAQ